MTGTSNHKRIYLGASLLVLALAATALSQVRIQVQSTRPPEPVLPPAPSPAIQPEPVAETRLLMQGISQPNYRGIQRHLIKEPETVEAWAFLRGQALLVAESANLLMMRPPRAQGEESWLVLAAGQRSAATRLARAAADRDYVKSRVALADLTNSCNRCHRAFRVKAAIDPLPAEK